jgi:predicted DNA-binding transcriptional regulator AlpA
MTTKHMEPHRGLPPSEFITVPALAARWSMSLAGVYRAVADGTLPSLRLKSAIRIPLDAVARYEREHTVGAKE